MRAIREFIKRNALAIVLWLLSVMVFLATAVLYSQATQPPPLEVAPYEIPGRDLSADLFLDVSKGNVEGHSGIIKFGRSTNVDSGVDTDIWDRANATDDQDIWVAPTVTRQHVITSTSASDDGDPAGVGAQTLTVCGLTDWDTKEVCETVTLQGTFSVTTTNSFVIIHRMFVATKGATNVNVGVVTATALTDDTVTAQINVGQGQTQMAIRGIPSVQTFYIVSYDASFNKSAGATGAVDISLLVNPEPDSELINFLTKDTQAVISTGNSLVNHPFTPYFQVPGPAIIKVQGAASAANIDISAGFGGILVDN